MRENIKGNMKTIISALLLILALHFLLESIQFRSFINLSHNENFDNKKGIKLVGKGTIEGDIPDELKSLDKIDQEINDKDDNEDEDKENFSDGERILKRNKPVIQCKEPKVKGYNLYPFTENDANFGSDVMNLNHFYKKNFDAEPTDNQMATSKKKKYNDNQKVYSPAQPSTDNNLQPNTWKYYNELAMNGGDILPGLTGYDSLSDQYSLVQFTPTIGNCDPPTRGAKDNDDLRMGMGLLKSDD